MSSDGDNAHSLAGGNVIMSEDLHEANKGHSCTAVNANTGAMCGETEGLRILDQFRQIYEARMQKIEQDEATGTEIDFVPMKLNVMKEWIKDLGEQNVMLVRTVEDLEQAACYRVKILEEKLKETAGIVSEKMSRLTKPSEDTVNNLSTRIYQLEKEEETLQEKIEYLRSDIRGLLELIRRARCENCWCLKGIKFYEIRANEIPLPTVCSCTEVNPCPSIAKELRLILELDDLARDRLLRSASSQIHDYVDRSACPICSERQTHDAADNESVKSLKRRLEVLSENEKKAHEYQAELEEKVSDLDNKLISREETIKKYISMLQSLRDNLKKRWAPKSQKLVEPSRQCGQDLEFDIASFVEMVECAIATRTGEEDRRENEKKHVEKPNSSDVVVEELRAKLQEKSLEIERLSRRLSFLEKESLETREALTNEVAEKHDMGMALRAEVATLEEQCRRANMLMQFKEDIIKGMRRELKQRVNTKATDTGSSGRKVRINADVVYCDQPAESSPRISMNRHGSHLVSDLNKAKASWKRENEALYYLRTELEEVLEELHAKEREDYERDIASAHVKLKDIGTLLDNYNTEVIDRNDTKRQERQSDSKVTIQKLAKSIANLSNVCVESASGIVLLERALEDSDDTSANQETRVGHEFNERWKWDVFDRQFNAMEEFRVCTVEAQAATENLREEMEIVIGNLQTRHQQYVDLSSVVKEMQNVLAKTKENVTAVMCRLEQQEQEKICHNEKIASSEAKLKDMKNEINKARLERSRDVVDFSGRHRNTSPMTDPNAPTELIDKVVDTVAHVVCHLRLIRSQDQCGASLLGELRGQLCTLERNLDDVQNEMDRVLSENEIAQKVLNEKIERLDKFERELDYAHTKMQDTLESIVQSKQRMIDVGVCNLCSCTPNDGAMPGFETTPRNEDNRKNSSGDVDQLKNALRSKDKLLEDKDEIIRIQKDSITMTHVELKDLHQKMQAKIDAQNVAIAQHVEEKRLLLEQSKLQSQTIGHLREAVVEAKRSRTAKQQSHQKSALDLSVSECCDKDETIRMLSLFLRETQAQYNDCFTEAAEQDTRLEIQRQAIESLQKAIICRDLVYYSLLIKAQAFFRGRIGDVRLIRSKMDSLAKSKQYLEDKCRRIKRLWREADRELRKIKCITSWELNCEQGSRDCATCTDALERCSNAETETRVNNLLRENEDLKRQLKSRRLEIDLFDQEVRGQLYNNNRTEGLADGSAGLRDSEDCPNINCMSSNDELNRRNTELDKLINEAKDKQEELAMLQDMREQFETSENLERLNECLKKELFILRRRAEGDYSGRERGLDDLQPMHSEARQNVECMGGECARERERDSMKGLRDQLSSTRELTDECMAELRVSREMLSFLRGRICSLKKLLKEKSDEMAKLQADHQMIKNDYSILKTENGIFADKARAEIGEFREKLKALQAELRLVDGNYRRVSEDFDKSQKLLIEAARREVELQHGVTAMEQIFYSKLTSAEREGRRMSDLVDMLRSDLENAREELSAREENFAEKCRNAYDQMGTLEDRVALLEDSKLLLTRQLQECRLENCKLVAENTRLMENGCRCVQELEDTRNVLLELRGECKTKAQTLNSISAELNHVAASRSELCDESQLVVACIRAWIEEQRRLVENLSKKLKNEKNRIARYAFEKKALVATVKELTRVNGTLSEFSIRRKICQGHSPNRRYAKSNGHQTSASYNGSQKPVLTTSSTTVCTRPLKRRCVCLTRTSRRTLLRGNSWWFPKLEHVSKELCRKNRRRGEKRGEEYRGDETSIDETRDFGYQSSASK